MTRSNTGDIIYFGVLNWLVITAFLGGVLLWARRKEGERARKILSITLLIISCLMATRLFAILWTREYEFIGIMSYPSLILGLSSVILLTLYPMEVIRPGLINRRNLLLCFSPLIIIYITQKVLFYTGAKFEMYHNWHDLFSNITEVSVWWRFIILSVILIYSLIILYIPHSKINNTSNRWIRSYTVGVLCVAILYIAHIITGNKWVHIIHHLFCTATVAFVVYQELYIRLFIITPVQEKPILPDRSTSVPFSENLLWMRLLEYMETDEPWRNPDITIAELADVVNTGRTTLWAEIKANGYNNFHEFIAQYRIEAFCRLVRKEQVINLNDAFYKVGFRSRNTAHKRFKKYIGMTPAEYMKIKK